MSDDSEDDDTLWKLNADNPFVQAFGAAFHNPNLRQFVAEDIRAFTAPELMALMCLRMAGEPMTAGDVRKTGGYNLPTTRRALQQLEKTAWAKQDEGRWSPL